MAGFQAIGNDHAAAEVALDAALVLAMLGKWEKANRLLEGPAKVLGNDQVAEVAAAIAAHELETLAASLAALSHANGQGKSPAVIAAGL